MTRKQYLLWEDVRRNISASLHLLEQSVHELNPKEKQIKQWLLEAEQSHKLLFEKLKP